MTQLNDKRRKGRSLNLLSVGIIIYVMAGGSFSNEGSFLGGAIIFEHPEILEYATLAIFFLFHIQVLDKSE